MGSRRGRTARGVLAVAAVALGVGAAGAAPAQGGMLTPLLDCVEYEPSIGVVTAHFGYFNDAGVPLTPAPTDNHFDPPPYFRGQPLTFAPGRVHRAFQVSFRPSMEPSLTWVLDGSRATATNDPATYCGRPPGDTTRPLVLSAFPTGTGAARADDLTVTFSEPMNAATITGATFVLHGWDGRKKAWQRVTDTAVRCGSPCVTATLDPARALDAKAQYRGLVAASVQDVAGNPMGQDFSWTFGTGKR